MLIENTYLKMWPLFEGTISILKLCGCLLSQCRRNWSNRWGVTGHSAGLGMRLNLEGLQVDNLRKESLWPSSAGDRKAPLLLIPFHIKSWAEKVKDDSISTLGRPLLWVARCDKLHVWAFRCEVLSSGSELTVAAHLTCLRWIWKQGQKAWISANFIKFLENR